MRGANTAAGARTAVTTTLQAPGTRTTPLPLPPCLSLSHLSPGDPACGPRAAFRTFSQAGQDTAAHPDDGRYHTPTTSFTSKLCSRARTKSLDKWGIFLCEGCSSENTLVKVRISNTAGGVATFLSFPMAKQDPRVGVGQSIFVRKKHENYPYGVRGSHQHRLCVMVLAWGRVCGCQSGVSGRQVGVKWV